MLVRLLKGVRAAIGLFTLGISDLAQRNKGIFIQDPSIGVRDFYSFTNSANFEVFGDFAYHARLLQIENEQCCPCYTMRYKKRLAGEYSPTSPLPLPALDGLRHQNQRFVLYRILRRDRPAVMEHLITSHEGNPRGIQHIHYSRTRIHGID